MDDVQKKRHHYVPVASLNRFADSDGRIYAFRKNELARPLHLRPSEIAFERYYYSQPLPEGGQDTNRLEDLFSKVETTWPALVDDLTAGRGLGNHMEQMFEFIGLLRVRGRAARDPVELCLGHIARRKMMALAESGRLPPPPAGLTFDDIESPLIPTSRSTPWCRWFRVSPDFGSSADSKLSTTRLPNPSPPATTQ